MPPDPFLPIGQLAARTGLAALEGIVALAEGDQEAAAALRAKTQESELGVNQPSNLGYSAGIRTGGRSWW